MGIVVKNFPKDLELVEPEPGDVVICANEATWIVAENGTVVCLEDGRVQEFDDIRVVKVFTNCELKLNY
jgi:hypothetical protein